MRNFGRTSPKDEQVPPAPVPVITFDDLIEVIDARWPGAVTKLVSDGHLVHAFDRRGRRKLVACCLGLQMPYGSSRVFDMARREFVEHTPTRRPGWYFDTFNESN